MTSHRADRGTRTVALTELADPPALPSLPTTKFWFRRRAVSLAAGAVAFAGMFSMIHDNLLDHPAPSRIPAAPPPRAQQQPAPPGLAITPTAQQAAVETSATPQLPPAQAAPARQQPAATKPAPSKQTGFQQWIPQPALSMINHWWPR